MNYKKLYALCMMLPLAANALDVPNLAPVPSTTHSAMTSKPIVSGYAVKKFKLKQKPKSAKNTTPIPAYAAVRKSTEWSDNRQAMPVMDKDGKLVYVYGESRPTIICAPLHVCSIELEPGETVNDVHIGDPVRWGIMPAISGVGGQKVVHVVIKPKEYGLDTNAMISTDKRAYYLRLISSKDNSTYTTRVGFYYPEHARRTWERQQAAMAHEEATVVANLAANVEQLNFNYDIAGSWNFKPVRVFDDGAKVYIQMADDFQHKEAPALFLLGKDGAEQLVNYRLKDNYYVVDKLFSKAALILGVGSEQKKVVVTRLCKNRGFFGGCKDQKIG